MQLTSPHGTRERIMAMGPAGVGKSRGLLSIAKRCPGNTFHIVDNDDAIGRMLEGETFHELGNVVAYVIDDFAEHIDVVTKLNETISADDWLVVDILSPTWDMCQQDFIERIFAKDIDEYFLEVRRQKADAGKDKKALGALEGLMDWPVINKMYARFRKLLRQTPGHLYVTAEVTQVGGFADRAIEDRDIKAMFGPYGVKPVGQKRMPHIFQTILYLTKTKVGEYFVTTIKDRERQELDEEPLNDLAVDYLAKVAGWTMQR